MKIPNIKGLSHRKTERVMRRAGYRARVKMAGSRHKMRRNHFPA